MTEEEAVEELKFEIDNKMIRRTIFTNQAIKVVLNLIEKLQKENEELKNKVVKRDNEIIQLEESAEKEFLTKQEVKENYIPKDKIREKIEILKKEATDRLNEGRENIFVTKMLIIDILEELLEEE